MMPSQLPELGIGLANGSNKKPESGLKEGTDLDGQIRSLKTQLSIRKSLLAGAFLTKVRPELHGQALVLRRKPVSLRHGSAS